MTSNNNRVETHNSITKLVAMTQMLYSIPATMIPKTEAIVVFPGLGESWRVQHAIQVYESYVPKVDYLMVAGHNPSEKFFEDFSLEGLKKEPYNLIHSEGIISTDHATNTLDQCIWVCDMAKNHGLTRLTLTASPYHLLRAYLTLLKTFLKTNIKEMPFIVPSPTIVSPEKIIPETDINAWDMTPGEIGRIPKYQETGDVATYDELCIYLKYFWENFQ